MSKGHGKVERRVLELLNEDEPGVFYAIELAAKVFDSPVVKGVTRVTRAQLYAGQRALRKLAAEGLVGAIPGRLNRRKVWAEKSRVDELVEGLHAFEAWQARQATERVP